MSTSNHRDDTPCDFTLFLAQRLGVTRDTRGASAQCEARALCHSSLPVTPRWQMWARRDGAPRTNRTLERKPILGARSHVLERERQATPSQRNLR